MLLLKLSKKYKNHKQNEEKPSLSFYSPSYSAVPLGLTTHHVPLLHQETKKACSRPVLHPTQQHVLFVLQEMLMVHAQTLMDFRKSE